MMTTGMVARVCTSALVGIDHFYTLRLIVLDGVGMIPIRMPVILMVDGDILVGDMDIMIPHGAIGQDMRLTMVLADHGLGVEE